MNYFEIPFIVAKGDCTPIAVKDRLQGPFIFNYVADRASVARAADFDLSGRPGAARGRRRD